MAGALGEVRIEGKIDKLAETMEALTVNYSHLVTNQALMQQEIQAIARAMMKLEEVDKKMIACQGDCGGRADLLQKDVDGTAKDIAILFEKVRFRDKIILGLSITVFLRMLLFFLLGVK
jgi:hypothetical protein